MTNTFSMLRCEQKHRDILAQQQAQQNLYPAIEFYPRFKKADKEKDSKEGKSESVSKFEVPLDVGDTESKTYDYYVSTYDRGTPEEYCNMRVRKVEGLATKLGFSSHLEHKTEDDFKERKAEHLI